MGRARQDLEDRGLTRGEVAGLLGTSVSSVRRMEGKQLHPCKDEAGVWRFDVHEVKKIEPRWKQLPSRRPRTEGRLAAEVFEMFEDGAPLADIVIQTKQPPAVIRKLYTEYSVGLEEGEWERRLAEMSK